MNMEKQVKSNNNKVSRYSETKKIIGSMIAVMALFLISCTSVHAVSFSWSGAVVGEDQSIIVSGNADFDIFGGQLRLVLENTSDSMTAIGQSLSGLTWDFTGSSSGVTLIRDSAILTFGSSLIAPSTSEPDLSGEWAYKDDIEAGILGSHGVGAMGDILDDTDSFGGPDLFDQNQTAPYTGPGGRDYMIVNNVVDLTTAGFQSDGPFVDNSVTFLWDFTGALDVNEIDNVNALFGTDGQVLVPEPATIALLSIGLVGLAGAEVRRRRRKKAVDKS